MRPHGTFDRQKGRSGEITRMNAVSAGPGGDLANKIARLVEERGWNQEDFARISQAEPAHGPANPSRRAEAAAPERHRQPVRRGTRPHRQRTAQPAARTALAADARQAARRRGGAELLYERAALPDLVSWLERNRDRAAELRPDEIQELLDMQAPGGPLEKLGVETASN